MKQQLDLIFPQSHIQKPVIHTMSQKFGVVFNIRRARVTETIGEMILELEGDESVLNEAVSWLRKEGIRVEPITHDAVEG